jgi:hypothetical protein
MLFKDVLIPKAPQRKRPCRSRALSLIPNRSFVELRVREPRQGLVAFRHLQKSLTEILQMNPKPASMFAFSRPSCKTDARC